jgi:hypothetical protein
MGEEVADGQANSLKDASIVRIRPKKGKGKGEMIPLESKTVYPLTPSCHGIS